MNGSLVKISWLNYSTAGFKYCTGHLSVMISEMVLDEYYMCQNFVEVNVAW